MKPNTFFSALLFLTFLFFENSFSKSGDPHTNQLTIGSNRVFQLNGEPFFPIIVSHELGENKFREYFLKPDTTLWGFNVINLHMQVKFLFSCGYGYSTRNIISGDDGSSSQYAQLLSYWDTDVLSNANRIFDYCEYANGKNVYVLSDCFAFYPNTAQIHYNPGGSFCGDSVVFDPRFNQTVRNKAIDTLNYLAQQENSKLIGFFSMDDANLMKVQPHSADYYKDNIEEQIENLTDTYDYAKTVYPNSAVFINLPPILYPRVFDEQNWQNMTKVRQEWMEKATSLANAGDVLMASFFDFETWSDEWRIFDGPGYPSWYIEWLDMLFNNVLSGKENKAVIGGSVFDNPDFTPDVDSYLDRKHKWSTYIGLLKGATGLHYFGWHTVPYGGVYASHWTSIKNTVDTLANIKNLDALVFTKTNSGPVGHSVSGSLLTGNVSYTVYKINNWNEYYILITNNPVGSLNGTPESNNTITVTSDVNLCFYDVKEVFSNNTVTPSSNHQFEYVFPWFGTGLFHVKLKSPPPDNCVEERPGNNDNIPNRFYINQNYPNPFNPSTEIVFGLPKDEFVTLEVYNSLGQKVKTLLNENRSAGSYTITFDARNYASGVYIYKIKAGNFTETKKMLLVK